MSLGRSVSAAAMLGPTKVSFPTDFTFMLSVLQVVRRVDRPRPLKLSAANRLSALELSSVEDVVVLMENVCRFLRFQNLLAPNVIVTSPHPKVHPSKSKRMVPNPS